MRINYALKFHSEKAIEYKVYLQCPTQIWEKEIRWVVMKLYSRVLISVKIPFVPVPLIWATIHFYFPFRKISFVIYWNCKTNYIKCGDQQKSMLRWKRNEQRWYKYTNQVLPLPPEMHGSIAWLIYLQH